MSSPCDDYAELQVTSNCSFLRGASHPEELVVTAAALGHKAIAITDRNTLAGVVRAHAAAEQTGIRLVVGVRLDLVDGPSLLCFPTDRAGLWPAHPVAHHRQAARSQGGMSSGTDGRGW